MTRLLRNFLNGDLDSSVSDTDTTLSSPGFADLPVVSSPDIMALVLDPLEADGAPEIVHVTDHTSGATTATVLREQEATTARSHASGTAWIHAITETHWKQPWRYDIEKGGDPGYTDQGLSDELTGSSINSSWTVVSGSSGTVDVLGTVTGAVYDLDTRASGMLVQTGNGSSDVLELRASIMADGEELIVACTKSEVPGDLNNQYQIGLNVSENSSGKQSGDYGQLVYDGSQHSEILLFDTGDAIGTALEAGGVGARFYLRLIRSGDDYHFLFSTSGDGWVPLGAINSSLIGYVWVWIGSSATWARQGGGDPITAVHWIRHVTHAGYDPW